MCIKSDAVIIETTVSVNGPLRADDVIPPYTWEYDATQRGRERISVAGFLRNILYTDD